MNGLKFFPFKGYPFIFQNKRTILYFHEITWSEVNKNFPKYFLPT